MPDIKKSDHRSEDHFFWVDRQGRRELPYDSQYAFQHCINTGPQDYVNRCQHLRFPRLYDPPSIDKRDLNTSVGCGMKIVKEDTFVTPLAVMAASQQPFLKKNRWKYSYHGVKI